MRNLVIIAFVAIIVALASCKKESNHFTKLSPALADMGTPISPKASCPEAVNAFIRGMQSLNGFKEATPSYYDERLLQFTKLTSSQINIIKKSYYVVKDGDTLYPVTVPCENITIINPDTLFNNVRTELTKNPDNRNYSKYMGYRNLEKRFCDFDLYGVKLTTIRTGCLAGRYECEFIRLVFLPRSYLQ